MNIPTCVQNTLGKISFMTSQMIVKADEPKTNTIKGQLKLLDVFGS